MPRVWAKARLEVTLDSDAVSLYLPDFLPKDDADAAYEELSKLSWNQHIIPMYGKKIPAPRLFQWRGVLPTRQVIFRRNTQHWLHVRRIISGACMDRLGLGN